ncbi:MAG: hypothetical protein ACLRX5_03795 [Slackia sp.]
MVEAGAEPAAISSEVYQNRSFASLMLEKAMLENIVMAEDGLWAFSHVRQDDFERLGAVKADAEPLVDVLRSLAGVRVACMVREQASGARGSLRAKGDEGTFRCSPAISAAADIARRRASPSKDPSKSCLPACPGILMRS